MPSRISFAQEIAYLPMLANIGNASLAAAQTGCRATGLTSGGWPMGGSIGCAGRWSRGSGICRRR
jgi:hypothetical protein